MNTPDLTPDAVVADTLALRRIEPAYQQIASQLRALILEGRLPAGSRLPTEDKLCATFGVSRTTVREALRMLSADNLVITTRGATGGTFVTTPDVLAVQQRLQTSLRLLNGSNEISHDELYEARVLLEIPAVRAATRRRTPEGVARLRALAADVEAARTTPDRTTRSEDFHQAIFDIAGNRVIALIAPPIWAALSLSWRERGSAHSWASIDHEHDQIMEHIERGDEDGAARAMLKHLQELRDIRRPEQS
ncbi:FadR/GntR family transcriptional regulator [Litorihabitans aurantiacus]|uniref:GntR family transcriptional regulator n=1 Tax=Litorihabitans aurantiacus TaxID=1930061 RepID=A0AA37ULY9_9MICO|nr:FadR/GntR family transcriptional regulator [Litorihabitans aurantiacus]GMA30895.1 GntR family transcriptional regulator [Litorihabitans aurantiacus]